MTLQKFRQQDDKVRILNAMTRLFTTQDRKKSDSELQILVDEISAFGYSTDDIIKGILAMRDKDYKQIKLWDIKKSVEDSVEFVEKGEVVYPECDYCDKIGLVRMLTETSGYAFRCTCEAGNAPRNNGLPQWNGQETQIFNGKLHKLFRV